jgi:hypothetical protein
MLESTKNAVGALKGWKTLIASLAIAGAGVLQSADWATIVPAGTVGPVMHDRDRGARCNPANPNRHARRPRLIARARREGWAASPGPVS